MAIDIYAKSVQLLERIANSVYERDPKSPNLFCFTTNEVAVVEEWIEEFIQEVGTPKPESRDTNGHGSHHFKGI